MSKPKYQWAVIGDLNAFFALFLDNVVNLFVLTTILVVNFGMPREFIYTRIIPGTSLGVMIGDLLYCWMAVRLAKQTGNPNVTAMPLGLDMPSTVGIAYVVIGPSFLVFNDAYGGDIAQASLHAWYVGIGAMMWMAVIKLFCVAFGPYVQRVLPAAGMVGSIAGIGLVWLGAQGLIGVYAIPFVGLLSLIIIVYTMMAHFEFPLNLPGAAAAVLIGTAVYYVLGAAGFFETIGIPFNVPGLEGLGLHLPLPQPEGIKSMFGNSLGYISMAIPFAILVITQAINITEAAKLVGDTFNTRKILLADALATFVAGICGGVAQSTPYFGHSAYKRMGAHAAYTLAAGLVIGLGGVFGLIGFMVDLIPDAAVKPILIFIGFDMIRVAFQLTPQRHIMAVVFAIVPSIINYSYTHLKTLYGHVQTGTNALKGELETLRQQGTEGMTAVIAHLDHFLPARWIDEYIVFGVLGQGFILTAMIWGAAVAYIIDRRISAAAVSMFLAAFFSFVGMIHSVYPSGNLYWPWQLELEPGNGLFARSLTIPYEFTAAYILVAITLLLMHRFSSARKGEGPSDKHD